MLCFFLRTAFLTAIIPLVMRFSFIMFNLPINSNVNLVFSRSFLRAERYRGEIRRRRDLLWILGATFKNN